MVLLHGDREAYSEKFHDRHMVVGQHLMPEAFKSWLWSWTAPQGHLKCL